VKLLLKKGTNRKTRKIDGEIAVDVAARKGHKEVLKLLTVP